MKALEQKVIIASEKTVEKTSFLETSTSQVNPKDRAQLEET